MKKYCVESILFQKSLLVLKLASGLLLKKLNYFEVMLNIFEFSRVWDNVESWLV